MATKDFKVKNGLRVGGNITIDSGNIVVSGKEVISIAGSITGQYAGFDSDFSVSILNTTTDSLGEGLLNLYYTDSRVQSYLTINDYAKLSNID